MNGTLEHPEDNYLEMEEQQLVIAKYCRFSSLPSSIARLCGPERYDRAHYGVVIGDAVIDITIETHGPAHIAGLKAALDGAGYSHQQVQWPVVERVGTRYPLSVPLNNP